jgi:hypothetical protein
MHKLFCSFFFVFIFCNNVFSQDSSHLRISLLTCTPGDELYSIFGHSAIRIKDGATGTDIVYNYGTFDFDDAGFYMKFIRGKLLYYVSAEYYTDFRYLYLATGRGITEQVLNLAPEEKVALQKALNENLKEENKYYKYDFFFDNCTTRLRDILLHFKQPTPVLPAVMPLSTTFRNAIHQYLDNGRQYWSKLGIDILLGARTDRIMLSTEQQFLPDNLMIALDKASIPVVEEKNVSQPFSGISVPTASLTPTWFFLLLFLLFFALSFAKDPRIKMILSGLDGMLFFMTGLLGIILIFMWAGTDHTMTKNNWNLLWAWPTHLVAAFLLKSKNKAVKNYFLITAAAMILVLLSWFFLPQQMNPSLIPFVMLIIYRSANKYLTT